MTNNEYTSTLKGWAVDRAIKMLGNDTLGVESLLDVTDEVILAAQKLVDYCYNPQEEIDVLQQRLADLEHSQATKAAIEMPPASNRVTQ